MQIEFILSQNSETYVLKASSLEELLKRISSGSIEEISEDSPVKVYKSAGEYEFKPITTYELVPCSTVVSDQEKEPTLIGETIDMSFIEQ